MEIVFLGVLDAQLLGQRGMPPQPGGGQFRTRVQQPLDDHGHDEVALARGFRGQQAFQAELAQGTEHGFDVPVGAGAADDADEGIRQVGEIAGGFVMDLLTGTKAAAEQVGGIGFAFVAVCSCGYKKNF